VAGTWIALFGPFGEPNEWSDLVWTFVELASAHGGRPAFYQVEPASLPLYLDCGLQAFKLGEYAHIELPEFSLKGAKRANLRSGMNRGEREGLSFEVLAPGAATSVMSELQVVSDAWLEKQNTRRSLAALPYARVSRFRPCSRHDAWDKKWQANRASPSR
jgi:phosphatidylglycerol lysyltransferase